MQEIWTFVNFAPNYEISNTGKIRNLDRNSAPLKVGRVTDGSLSVVLTVEKASRPYLVRRLVAEAFCARIAPNCDTVIQLDNDKDNCDSANLMWRPRWYAIRYSRQFNAPIRSYWYTPVVNLVTGEEFRSVLEAGMHYGMLWADIGKSAVEGRETYPFRFKFAFL